MNEKTSWQKLACVLGVFLAFYEIAELCQRSQARLSNDSLNATMTSYFGVSHNKHFTNISEDLDLDFSIILLVLIATMIVNSVYERIYSHK